MLGFGSGSEAAPSQAEAVKYRKAHEVLARPRFSQTLTLMSGEQVSFAEAGDKQGFPVVWFAGPNSNRLLMALYDDMARESGLRLLCFDRPGRGASTPLRYPKQWEFRSWSVYLDEITQLLGIEKFSVIGHSIGASYALACYHNLKHKIHGTLRLIATWAPSNLPCMPVSYALQRSMPTGMLRRIYSANYSNVASSLNAKTVPGQMGVIGIREQINANDAFVHEVLDRVAEDYTGDAYKSFELDWLLALEISKPFGYDHRQLDCSIKCWHGMDDSISPLGAAMWMQREMKHFLLYAVEGATHNIILDFAIMRALFADIAKEAPLSPAAAAAAEKAAAEKAAADQAAAEQVAAAEQAAAAAQASASAPTTDASQAPASVAQQLPATQVPTPASTPVNPESPKATNGPSEKPVVPAPPVDNVWA